MQSIRLLRIASLAALTVHACAFSAGSPSRLQPPLIRGESRFFLDTAVEEEWYELLSIGVFHGITTNPTLLERAGVPCTISEVKALSKRALALTDEFMCQAWGQDMDTMYSCGMELSAPDRERIVIKVPVTMEGTKAAASLVSSGVRVCLTACYASHQALVAAATGAEYLAPYLGRMTDAGKNGLAECETMQRIVDGLGAETRILVASIRDVQSMSDLASSGLDTYTVSPDIARALFQEPLTEQAARDFEAAAKRGGVDRAAVLG